MLYVRLRLFKILYYLSNDRFVGENGWLVGICTATIEYFPSGSSRTIFAVNGFSIFKVSPTLMLRLKLSSISFVIMLPLSFMAPRREPTV